MAKTWTLNEAYDAIKKNDAEGIADFGKRFPLATTALARAGVNEGLDVLFGAMPDRVTMRILEMSLKDGVTESDDENEVEDEVVEEKTEKVEKAPKIEKKEKKAKAEKEDKPEKAEKTEKKAKAEKAPKKAEPVEDEDAEDDTPDYKSMDAVALYKLCKKRGIEVETRQKASVYIKALEAADKADTTENDGEDDDWDI